MFLFRVRKRIKSNANGTEHTNELSRSVVSSENHAAVWQQRMAKGRLETLSLRLVRDDGDELGLVACDCTARLLATNLQRHGAQRRTETQSQTSSMVEHRGGHIARIPNMVFFKLLVFGLCFFRKNDVRSQNCKCWNPLPHTLFNKFVLEVRRKISSASSSYGIMFAEPDPRAVGVCRESRWREASVSNSISMAWELAAAPCQRGS